MATSELLDDLMDDLMEDEDEVESGLLYSEELKTTLDVCVCRSVTPVWETQISAGN
jgi:hypothetical protein